MAGRNGEALHLNVLSDGGVGSVDFGAYSAFNIAGDFTVALWINFDAPPANSSIVGRPYSWGLGLVSDSISFSLFNALPAVGGPIPAGEWVHVAGVFHSDKDVEVYRNGALQSAASDASTMTFPATSLVVNVSGAPFSGQIDDLILFGRALSPAEIAALAH
jgi:hypothetical protein